jgi:hypothetical protein
VDPKYLVVAAVFVVMGWFAWGMIFNLRRGEKVLRWMQGGLPRIGERTTFRWLGTSVAELVIAHAKTPFRRLETLLVLSPRDVPWFWLLALVQGRRDTLIFRAHLSVAPRVDLDLADPTIWTGRMALRQATQRGWESGSYQGLQLMAPPGLLNLAQNTLSTLSVPGEQLASRFWRLSLRRNAPHLELHIPFPDTRQDANQWFAALQAFARAVGNIE